MSLGINSLWRARLRCVGITGLPMISRGPAPSLVSVGGRSTLVPLLSLLRLQSTLTDELIKIREPDEQNDTSEVKDRLVSKRSAHTEEDFKRPASRAFPGRRRFFQEAFTRRDETFDTLAEQHRKNPLVSPAFEYPVEAATAQSQQQNRREARRLVGYEFVQRDHFDKPMPQWIDCLHTLKRLTPQWSERPSMSAIRVVLPDHIDMDIGNKSIAFVDTATGLLNRLRTSVDKNPSAVILRGQSSVLAKAADQIVEVYPEVKVYELGEVAASDYKTKRVWPAIESALGGGDQAPDDRPECIWLHREHQPYEITIPYEEVPKPKVWTYESFESYIASLVYGRLASHLAIPFYGKKDQRYGRWIDTDGIRINLIADAFEDPEARPYITAFALNMALSLMATRGGHRATGDHLIRLAEAWGVPMDTKTYNIILDGYCRKGDVTFFHLILRRMQTRFFHPNVRTWLLFLQLLKTENERRQVILAMYELGMFNDSSTRKGIAEVMATDDVRQAMMAGKTLDGFLKDQTARYGSDWMTIATFNKVIVEMLRFDRPTDPRLKDVKSLIENQMAAGLKINTDTINILLQHASSRRAWGLARWVLTLGESHGCELDQASYQHLVYLATVTRSPYALGALFFYGVLHRKLRTSSREMLSAVLLRRHPDPFWLEHQPFICPAFVLAPLETDQVVEKAIMSRLESSILTYWDGWVPTQLLSNALAKATLDLDQPLRTQYERFEPKPERKPYQRISVILELKRAGAESTSKKPRTRHVRLTGLLDAEKMIFAWIKPELRWTNPLKTRERPPNTDAAPNDVGKDSA